MKLPTTYRGAARALALAALTAGALATSALGAPGGAPDRFGESDFDVIGTRHDDVQVGTPGPDRIYGGRGADRIIGLGGDDVLCGGAAAGAARQRCELCRDRGRGERDACPPHACRQPGATLVCFPPRRRRDVRPRGRARSPIRAASPGRHGDRPAGRS